MHRMSFLISLTLVFWHAADSISGDVSARAFADQSVPEVPSGDRVALLLGNAHYPEFTLGGVRPSLDTLERALRKEGFRVRRHEDLTGKDQKQVVQELAQSVPTNGIVLVYYLGLAAHVERLGKHENYLRPVDATIRNENDYRSQGLPVTDLIRSLQQDSGARASLLFLDACWDSPIRPERDALHGGLRAPPRNGKSDEAAASTVMVMFAADSEQTIPVLPANTVSPLARSLSEHFTLLESSLQQACQRISTDLTTGDLAAGASKHYFGGASQQGIGSKPTRPTTETVREGETPGEGLVNSLGMTFRWCPPGSFTMGSPEADTPATHDRQPVQVTLSQGYWMGEHEVTQREYNIVMRKTVAAGFTSGKNVPFWGVTETKQVRDFCKKLNDRERKAGRLPSGWEYFPPTEAEWEYACRAGSQTRYCFGDSVSDLGQYGNFADQALLRTNPNYYWASSETNDGVGQALASVGSYRPNAWGLRDMHGNVAELVADHLSPKLPGGTDPLVQVKKDGRTQIRGGAWCSLPLYCESSFRNAAPGRDKQNFIGFRVALKKVK